MYYKDLLTKHLELVKEYRLLKNNPDVTTKELEVLSTRIIKINNKLNSGLIFYSNHPDKEQIKEYKKIVKHEFLIETLHGYSLESIIDYLDFNIPNPGLNPYNYVASLITSGYLKGDINALDSVFELTPKALRYLENEANITLKR